MEDPAAQAYVRVKYRPPAIAPELKKEADSSVISKLKKEKPPEEDDHGDLENFKIKPLVMFPGHTQNKRAERRIESDEVPLRTRQYPTTKQKVEITRRWIRKEIHETKIAAQREAMKRDLELKAALAAMEAERTTLLSPEEQVKAAEAAAKLKKEQEELEEKRAKLEEQSLQMSHPDGHDEGGDDEEDRQQREETKIMHELQMLMIKEKKIFKARDSRKYHQNVPFYDRLKLGLKLVLGSTSSKGKRLQYTEVLPWIVFGSAEPARDLYLMIRLGITHILNVTTEIDNFHPESFVYMRVPIEDKEDSDAGAHFPAAIDFIHRAYTGKGRIYIHCTAGVSRAPTFAMAYVISKRECALVDCYRYILARRPITNINSHFLFQLAELELSLGKGSSVLYHKDWRFYEFNSLRSSTDIPYREAKGTLRTTLLLLAKHYDEDDLFAPGS